MSTRARDKEYLEILVASIRVCSSYRPKMGKRLSEGFDLASFQKLYRADPFYCWFGLDNPLMYAAHKAAGGMTSVYRQIGLGCERLFRRIIQDELGLTDDQSRWSYVVSDAKKKARKLSLDGRVEFSHVSDSDKRRRIRTWARRCAKDLGLDRDLTRVLKGAVFEVRQGYKSKDAKRQNADIANAAVAYTKTYLPCAVVLSTQIDEDVATRYRNEKWLVLTGTVRDASPLRSTYAFMTEVIGYDLSGFFERQSRALRAEVEAVLTKLLSPTG